MRCLGRSSLTWVAGGAVGDDLRDTPDFHTEMEARMRMNW